jgi:hypothetical protein
MARHNFISDCENCGTEGVAGSHLPGHVFACLECQGGVAAPHRPNPSFLRDEFARFEAEITERV